MKKLLILLMGLSLTTTAVNTVISCTTKSDPERDNGGLEYQGDLKILNAITRQITDTFQQYATEKTLIDIKDYSIPEFENLFTIVNAAKPLQELDHNDQKVGPALLALVNDFLAVFDNINRVARKKLRFYKKYK